MVAHLNNLLLFFINIMFRSVGHTNLNIFAVDCLLIFGGCDKQNSSLFFKNTFIFFN